MPAIRARMMTPFPAETEAANSADAELGPTASPLPKVTFRPPSLGEAPVVREPFVRVGPRLRMAESFSLAN